jgi:RNA polymerase-binding transcription factor DksA
VKAAAKAPVKAAAKAPVKAAAKAPAKAPVKAPAKAPVKAPAKAAAKPEAPARGAVEERRSGSKGKAAGSAKLPGGSKPVVAATVIPSVKGHKDGVAFTKDFDAKFLLAMRAQLLTERDELTGQATRLEDEANALVAEAEMGDVQFDDEGGEGDTMVVERERALALSAQDRQVIADIEAALTRLQVGTYGYSVLSGRPIPRERLEAIPWADVLVEEKAGGLGRR